MKKKNPTFFYLLVPYGCILIIPIFVWLCSNVFIIDVVKKNMLSNMSATIYQSVLDIENSMNDVEEMVYSMAQNSAIKGFYDKKNLTHEEMENFKRAVASYNVENNLIKDIYL